MTNEQPQAGGSIPDSDHIEVGDESRVEYWAKKLDATPDQIKAAVERVGNLAADVEMDLKGTHSTTNADQEERAEVEAKDKPA